MSRFFSEKYASLVPYTPGEQPKNMQFIKLNTNESPFPPSEKAVEYARKAAEKLHLYSDPECRALTEKMAETLGVTYDEVLMTNGSDEILNFAFMAFCDKDHGAAFPDITYGFYPVFAAINTVPYEEIPLKDDFTIDIADYKNLGKTIFIANPNAPTGIALSRDEIEEIVKANPKSVVVIDEAYVDFGGESAVPLVRKYDNLLVTGTFSKSRSMAGARLGFGVACPALIRDLNTIKYSTNPYNVNAVTQMMGRATLEDGEYSEKNCRIVCETREYTKEALAILGFTVTDSRTNFLFASHPKFPGDSLYTALRENGILVRHFKNPRIADYNRITVGSRNEMEILIKTITKLLEEK